MSLQTCCCLVSQLLLLLLLLLLLDSPYVQDRSAQNFCEGCGSYWSRLAFRSPRCLSDKRHRNRRRSRVTAPADLEPYRTAVRFWGQTSQIPSSLSQKRDCSPRRVKGLGFGLE